MTVRMPLWITAALLVIAARPLQAQTLAGRVAIEAVAAASTNVRTAGDPMVILDLAGTVRLGDGWDVVIRPWSVRGPGGDWTFEMYQLQVRYVSPTRVPFRVDAGIMSSPLGLSTLELQPHRNPLIGVPFYYLVPLPPIDGHFNDLRLMSGGYPLGAMFSVSGTGWDARAGITDATPAGPRSVVSSSRPDAQPQLVLGAGVTPVTGLRLGAGFARGGYRPRTETPSGSILEPKSATVFNLEGEYGVGHTRVSGEWIRDRFDTLTGGAVARGFNVQASQTLSPRIFAAARATRASSPIVTAPVEVRRTSTAFEATVGYRLTTELTLRSGYQRERGFDASQYSNAAVMSIVWAERWW